MLLLSRSANCQVGGFALASIAWILCSVSTGLPQWRVWYLNESLYSEPSVAFIGMWRVCIYRQTIKVNNARECHDYTYHDNFVPWNIRIVQHLLLGSNILGLFGTLATIFALRNVYTRKVPKNATYNPFIISAILNIVASTFVLLAVLCNYFSVIHKAGIAFPPYFHMPLYPPNQRIGIANVVASLAALMFLGTGIIFLSYTSPVETQVYPDV
ncbi:claudin-34 [Cricetulus griseus]|uniref:Claudin-1-like protein n=1 Tax=Cricetulus griseus TaxID=10029 RepID=G3I463_CRIGR|nr:claudin-34 [Cricetulus griseus]XP_027288511.1 claudin-34 [Cricetulus griseus]EGW01388.1 Claudin-18 [Cricetulus griseus]ERE65252.1 claudin-1-like protein [Cricetulus griseus]